MIYKLFKLSKQRLFSENRLCFDNDNLEAGAAPEAVEFNIDTHIQSLNAGRRNFEFRADLTRDYLRNENIDEADFKQSLVDLGITEAASLDINNDQQLVTAIAQLQSHLRIAQTDTADGIDGILGNNTYGRFDTVEREVEAAVEVVELDTGAATEALTTETAPTVIAETERTTVPSPEQVTARDAVISTRSEQFTRQELTLRNQVLDQQISRYNENPENRTVESPEWMRERIDDNDTIQRMFIQNELNYGNDLRTHLGNLNIPLASFIQMFGIEDGPFRIADNDDHQISGDELYAASPVERSRVASLQARLQTVETEISELRGDNLLDIDDNADKTVRLTALRQEKRELKKQIDEAENSPRTFQQFLTELNGLIAKETASTITPTERAQLADMRNTFSNIQQILTKIPDLRWQQPTIIEKNYIEAAYVEPAVSTSIKTDYIRNNRSNPDLPFNLENDNDRLTLLAILTDLYGDPNSMIAQGIIEPGFEQDAENSKQLNLSANPTIFILNLGPHNITILKLLNKYPDLFDGNRNTDNLVEAIHDLKENNDYRNFKDAWLNERVENLAVDSSLSTAQPGTNAESLNDATVENYLDQIFPNRLNGPVQEYGGWFNNRYRELIPDLMAAGNVEGENQGDLTNRSYSDAAMENYLLGQIRTFEDGGVNYDMAKLETTLTELINFGKTSVMMRPEVSPADRRRLSTLNTANFDINTPRRLTQDEISLIRYGFEMSRDLQNSVDRTALEAVSASPQNRAVLAAIQANEQLRGENAPALTNEVLTLLAGLNLTTPPISLSDVSGAIEQNFTIYRSDNGQLTVGASIGTIGSGQIPQPGLTPVIGINFRSIPAQGIGGSTGLEVGIGTITASGTINYTTENGFRVGAGVTGGLYMGIPGVFGGLNIGRAYEHNINSAMERGAESIVSSLTSDQINRISSGNMSREDILTIANQQPIITQMFANQPAEFANTSDAVKNNIKIYFIEKICQELHNYGVENTRGIGWEIGINAGVIGGVPIFVPTLKVTIRTGTKWFYSSEIGASQAQAGNQALIRSTLETQFSALAESDNTTTGNSVLISDSGIINYDGATGAREVVRSTAPEGTDLAQITHESGLARLNNVENSIGLHFSLPSETEIAVATQRGDTSIDYVFSLNEINDDSTLNNTSNREFNIYTDPALGIKLVRLRHNRIGIDFGPGQSMPPRDLAITRSEVTNASGANLSSVSICFTNRPIAPSEIIQNPFNQDIIRVVNGQTYSTESPYFNSSPEARTRYAQQVEAIRSQNDSALNFDQAEIAAGTALFASIDSSNSLTRVPVTPEMTAISTRLLANTTFMTELRAITTAQTDGTLNTQAFRTLLSRYIDENPNDNISPEISDQLIMYLESVLMPNTFRQLSEVSNSRRLTEINRVTQVVMGRFVDTFLAENSLNTHMHYNAEGVLVPFTDEEKTQIKTTLINDNILNAANATDTALIAQIQNLENLTNVLGPLEAGTVMLTTSGLRNVAESQGFREMILHQSSTLQVLGTPSSLTLDGTNASHTIASEFIRNIVEPPFPTGEIGTYTTEQLQSLFNSETTLKVLSMNFRYNGQDLPVILALYGQRGTEIIRNLYEKISTPAEMTTYLATLSNEDKNLLNHFLNFTREIRSKSQNCSTVNLIPFGQETSIGAMTVGINAGTMFIANCGNITMFYNFELSASVNTHLGPDIITATAASMTQYNATAQAQTLGIGFSVATAAPNKTGDQAEGNANDPAAPSAGVEGAPRRDITINR